MIAVVRTGGKQHKVSPGDEITVEYLDSSVGSDISLDQVLLVEDRGQVLTGALALEGAQVRCTVLKQARGPKIRVQRYRAKKRYQRSLGHRQELTVLRVNEILAKGISPPPDKKATAATKTKAKAATKTKAKAATKTKANTKSKTGKASKSNTKTGK